MTPLPWAPRLAALGFLFLVGSAPPLATVGCASVDREYLDVSTLIADWQRRAPDLGKQPAATAPRPAEPPRRKGALTLADGLEIARKHNPALATLRARASGRSAEIDAAGTWSYPELGLGAKRVETAADAGWMVSTSLIFAFPVGGRLSAQRASASARKANADLAVAAGEWALSTQLRLAWLDWSAARARKDILAHHAEALAAIRSIWQRLEAAGEVGAEDVGLLELEGLASDQRLADAESTTESARGRLMLLMGLRPNATLDLVPDVAVVADPLADARAAQAEHIVRRHPLVRAAMARYGVDEAEVRQATTDARSDLRLGPAVEVDRGEIALGLEASMELPLLGTNAAAVAAARTERGAQKAAVAATVEGLLGRLQLAQGRLERAVERARRVRQELLPAAEARLDRVRQLTSQGEVPALSVHHALTRALEARLALIDAETSATQAAIDLRDSLGPKRRAGGDP